MERNAQKFPSEKERNVQKFPSEKERSAQKFPSEKEKYYLCPRQSEINDEL